MYASASFDARGDLKNCDRPYNVMPGGYDANNMLALDASLFSDAFVSYVNDCAAQLAERGASLWFSFPPMNAAAFAEGQDAAAFQAAVTEKLSCPVISAAEDYIMEAGWFYDSNFHLNEAGMTVRTVQLVNDVKNQLGNATKTDAVLPNMPVTPDEGVEGEGDNADSGCFTYELEDGYYTVTGLTEEGRAKTSLTLPYQVNGIYIRSFTAQTFAGDAAVESITIQENIRSLPDGCFSGCTALRSVYLQHEDPADIAVGYGLFEGTAGSCAVYVPQEALTKFANNYFWGRYADRLRSY